MTLIEINNMWISPDAVAGIWITTSRMGALPTSFDVQLHLVGLSTPLCLHRVPIELQHATDETRLAELSTCAHDVAEEFVAELKAARAGELHALPTRAANDEDGGQ